MTKTILITGASGTVASAAARHLKTEGHNVIGISRTVEDDDRYTKTERLDLLDTDDLNRLEEMLDEVDAVIHLAWNLEIENFDTGEQWPENIEMFENVLEASKNADVPIFVNGSSIHAGTGSIPAYTVEASLEDTPQPYRDSIDPKTEFDLRRERPEKLLSPLVEDPDSLYGESKVETERKLREATQSEDFILGVSIRIGGVNPDDKEELEGEPYYPSLRWSHKDLGKTIENIVTADVEEKNGYHQFYGVSDNTGRIFSIENSFTTPKS